MDFPAEGEPPLSVTEGGGFPYERALNERGWALRAAAGGLDGRVLELAELDFYAYSLCFVFYFPVPAPCIAENTCHKTV